MSDHGTVLVTGAAGGIGKALCARFAAEKYRIIGIDIKDQVVTLLQQELGIPDDLFIGLRCDVRDPVQIYDALRTIRRRFSAPDILINNAGGPSSNFIRDTTIASWRQDVELNLNAPYYMIQAILPHFLKQRNGTIINIASANGAMILGHPAYGAAKAGLIHLTKFVAVEFGRRGIRCNAIAPGTVRTEAWNERLKRNVNVFSDIQKMYPSNRVSEPREIAELVYSLAASDTAALNGAVIFVDGGLTAGLPDLPELFTQDAQSGTIVPLYNVFEESEPIQEVVES